MRWLLDTHIALWALADSPRLAQKARGILLDPDSVIAVSAASLWEVAIKHALRPAVMPDSAEVVLAYCREAGYEIIDMTAEAAVEVGRLPAVHQDPFDRMLVAQARVGGWRLLTADATLAGYGEMVLVV